MKDKVVWLDVVTFEDNSWVIEVYPVQVLKKFREGFEETTFSERRQLDDFFGGAEEIYDCSDFCKFIEVKYQRNFRAVRLDGLELESKFKEEIEKQIHLERLGGYIDGIAY